MSGSGKTLGWPWKYKLPPIWTYVWSVLKSKTNTKNPRVGYNNQKYPSEIRTDNHELHNQTTQDSQWLWHNMGSCRQIDQICPFPSIKEIYRMEELTRTYIKEIVKQYRTPIHAISNTNSQSTSRVWHPLQKKKSSRTLHDTSTTKQMVKVEGPFRP